MSAKRPRSTSSTSRQRPKVRRVDLLPTPCTGLVYRAPSSSTCPLTYCALAHLLHAAPAAEPVKRKRGRPPGSKNKKTLAAEQAKAAAAGPSTGAGTSGEQPVKRGRGRPPKVRTQFRCTTRILDLTSVGAPPCSGSRRRQPTLSLRLNASAAVPLRPNQPRHPSSLVTTAAMAARSRLKSHPRRRGVGPARTRLEREAHSDTPVSKFPIPFLCRASRIYYYSSHVSCCIYHDSATILLTSSVVLSSSRSRTVPYMNVYLAIVLCFPSRLRL